MEEEILELREEIDLLTKKVEILEKKENHRKALTYVKILVKIVLIGALAYGVYRGYEYLVKELPTIIVDKVKDTSKEKANNIKEAINGIFN